MRSKRHRRLRLGTLGLLLGGLAASPGAAQDAFGPAACRAAADVAGTAESLPAGLLLAIGQAESGQYDPATRRLEPWPWSANESGVDHVFASREEALAWTGRALAEGRRSIDVGCFQVNLYHHPDAFASLEEAFSPAGNARYAARFLRALFERTGSWVASVEQYHSANPALGQPYRSHVFALWGAPAPAPGAAGGTHDALGPIVSFATFAQRRPTMGVRVVTPSPAASGAAASVITWIAVPRRRLPRIVTTN